MAQVLWPVALHPVHLESQSLALKLGRAQTRFGQNLALRPASQMLSSLQPTV